MHWLQIKYFHSENNTKILQVNTPYSVLLHAKNTNVNGNGIAKRGIPDLFDKLNNFCSIR